MSVAKRPPVAHERIRDLDPGTFTTTSKSANSVLPLIKDTTLRDVWFYDREGKIIRTDSITKDDHGRILSINDGLRYAKVELYSNGVKKMFIKVYSAGRTKGEYIVDPNSFEGNGNELYQTNDKYGTRLCEYAPVNEEIFYQYTFYLQTKNPSRIKDVERKYLDGR